MFCSVEPVAPLASRVSSTYGGLARHTVINAKELRSELPKVVQKVHRGVRLTVLYRSDAITFTVGSDALPGVTRTYSSLAACADEIGMSRIYAGIHFRFDRDQGSRTGAQIGDYVSANSLLPNDTLPLVRAEVFTNTTLLLRVHGRLNATSIQQVSPDLRTWQPFATNTAAPGGVLVTDPSATSAGIRFYRAIEPQ